MAAIGREGKGWVGSRVATRRRAARDRGQEGARAGGLLSARNSGGGSLAVTATRSRVTGEWAEGARGAAKRRESWGVVGSRLPRPHFNVA
jgi:hypothetical protein